MNRRGFIQAILAAGVAPYVVTTSGILMPIRKLVVPTVEAFMSSAAAGEIRTIVNYGESTMMFHEGEAGVWIPKVPEEKTGLWVSDGVKWWHVGPA